MSNELVKLLIIHRLAECETRGLEVLPPGDPRWRRRDEVERRELVQDIRKSKRESELRPVVSEQARQRIIKDTGHDPKDDRDSIREKFGSEQELTIAEDIDLSMISFVLGNELLSCDLRLVDRVEPCQLCLMPVGLGRETPREPPVVCNDCFADIDPEAS